MYKQTKSGTTIIRVSDWACIPMSEDNHDYQMFLQWMEAGNSPLPPDEDSQVIPHVVSMRQARRALIENGMIDQVNAAISLMTGKEGAIARNEWEYATTVERDSPLVQALSVSLPLSSEELDTLFLLAGTF